MNKNELEAIVGKDYVFDDETTLDIYSKDQSLHLPKKPSLVVKPQNTEELQKVVRLANKHLVSLISVSSGIHFHGEAIPEQGGIVVDLRRMDRIIKIDERNRCVRIEPGVTWGQLQEELKSHDVMALNPLLPHKSKSVLTSSLEREPMLIPKSEYIEPILTMEIVLGNGEIFRTGSASSPGAPDDTRADLVNPFGPYLDFNRIFHAAQGTLGIATWINMKVEALPRKQKIFFIPFQQIEDVIEPLYRIQRKMLGNEFFALNNYNLASILTDEWPEQFKELYKTLPPWTLIICLAGSKRLPEEKIAYEEEALKEICLELGIVCSSALPGIVGVEKKMGERLRGPWAGEPYWKFCYKGSCQDIFFSTTLNRVHEFTKTIWELAAKYGYPSDDIGEYLQPLERGRACHCEYNLPYNSDDIKEVEKVQGLYNEASELLVRKGAFFSRPYGLWSDLMYRSNATYTLSLKKLKDIFDPNHIMNPGKLCF